MSETRVGIRRRCAVWAVWPLAVAVSAAAAEKSTPGATSLPDADGLRALVEHDPAALGPLSIGTPDSGLLFNPEPMPPGPLWSIREPGDAFATRETIEYLATAIEAVEAQFPGSPAVCIGDLSRADGGRLGRHRSHQAGRDADVGFYLRSGPATTFVRPRRNELDLPRTWALLRAFVTETDVQRIFLDRAIQRELIAYALGTGEDRAWLDELFGRQRGGKDAIVQHERRHQDHMHVRFYNPHAQEWGRLAYPLLVQAGDVPGPTTWHRVRSGETISQLARRYGTSTARIRAANGLRSNLLRAGHRYLIPVRAVPAVEPVLVPPRLLPPGYQPVLRAAHAAPGDAPAAATAPDAAGAAGQAVGAAPATAPDGQDAEPEPDVDAQPAVAPDWGADTPESGDAPGDGVPAGEPEPPAGR